jgi:hypothetical protein
MLKYKFVEGNIHYHPHLRVVRSDKSRFHPGLQRPRYHICSDETTCGFLLDGINLALEASNQEVLGLGKHLFHIVNFIFCCSCLICLQELFARHLLQSKDSIKEWNRAIAKFVQDKNLAFVGGVLGLQLHLVIVKWRWMRI